MRSCLLIPVFCCGLAAQVSLTPVTSFTHPIFAGNGTIGVCTDSFTGDIWVVDFSNTVNLHRFDIQGNLLSSHPTNVCTPSMTSPNDLTQDRLTGDLWLVDNDTGGKVLQFSTAGTCIGGFVLGSAYTNPVALAFNTSTGNLMIGHTGAVAEWSTAGVNLNSGFSTGPAGIPGIVSGLTYIPSSDHYLASASGSSSLTELTATGALVQSIPLGQHGVINIQAVDYDPFTGQVVVADNNTVTLHIYQDAGTAPQFQVNQTEAYFALNGIQGTSSSPATVQISPGASVALTAASTLIGSFFELAIGASPLVSVNQGALVTIDAQILNIDITDPFLSVMFNYFQSPPFVPISAPVLFPSAGAFSFQFGILDPSVGSGLRLSQPVRLLIN